jgi:hypothetical protein
MAGDDAFVRWFAKVQRHWVAPGGSGCADAPVLRDRPAAGAPRDPCADTGSRPRVETRGRSETRGLADTRRRVREPARARHDAVGRRPGVGDRGDRAVPRRAPPAAASTECSRRSCLRTSSTRRAEPRIWATAVGARSWRTTTGSFERKSRGTADGSWIPPATGSSPSSTGLRERSAARSATAFRRSAWTSAPAAHRRVRAARRQGGRDRSLDRGSSCWANGARRGARLRHRQGPRRRVRNRLRRSRNRPAERHPGRMAPVRCREPVSSTARSRASAQVDEHGAA